jgi:hypothetical protein
MARTRVALVLLVLGGCAEGAENSAYPPGNSEPALPPNGPATPPPQNLLVSDFVTSDTCSTSGVLGLALQISEEMDCMSESTLVRLSSGNGISFVGSAVLPYLEPDAALDLRAQANAAITSLFRAVVQQYLLYEWFQQARCGIAAAARPGNSNHETGRAVDLSNWASVIDDMNNHGWSHDVPGDNVHFDHQASADLRGLDVHAFQRLWNRNHPDDPIAEDGVYGPNTEARLGRSPSSGFAIGACGSAVPLSVADQEWLAGAALRPDLPENAD